jgi:hypothetical protein
MQGRRLRRPRVLGRRKQRPYIKAGLNRPIASAPAAGPATAGPGQKFPIRRPCRFVVSGAALLSAAKVADADKEPGTVEAGKITDLVTVPGDPLADISLMTKVSFVMKAGKVLKQ